MLSIDVTYVLCGHNMEKLLRLFDGREYVGQLRFQKPS